MAVRVFDRARSGLELAQAKLATTAHNSANTLTEGFERVQATGVEAAGGGVEVQISKEGAAAAEVAEALPGGPAKPVDDAIERTTAQALYRANLATVKVADEMTGELLDIVG
jgi:flagellar hook protein FlgE